MIDLVVRPELANALIEKVASFVFTFARKHAECGEELLCFYNDYGMQDRLQIPPDLWRKFLKPWWKKIISSLRKDFPECIFFLHSCGKIEEILPDLVEVGFDVLHPLQPECHDVTEVLRQFGSRISFWGTISAQKTIPFGKRSEIEAEVKSRVQIFKNMPVLIISPSNTIGGEVLVDNVVLVY